ncbi:MAG: phosphopantetheine-binding protein [Pseudomonadota bacterium]
MAVNDQIKALLNDVLQLGDRANSWNEQTPLLGSVAELDSMAVVSIITALEENFGFAIADDEINADVFATLGTLISFVEQKLAA